MAGDADLVATKSASQPPRRLRSATHLVTARRLRPPRRSPEARPATQIWSLPDLHCDLHEGRLKVATGDPSSRSVKVAVSHQICDCDLRGGPLKVVTGNHI